MFGDAGHGSLLFLFGLFIVLFKDCLIKYESFKAVLKVRYLVLMMGFFSIFCGFLYNDFMSIPMQWFSSCYKVNDYQLLNPSYVHLTSPLSDKYVTVKQAV